LRSLGGLLLKRLKSWVDQSSFNKVNFLNVAAQRVATFIIEWYTAAKTTSLIKVIATGIEVVATGIEVVVTGIEVVATWIEVVATWIEVVATWIEVIATGIEVVATWIEVIATGIEVASLVCAKDAFQDTVSDLHLLPSNRI